MEQKDRDILVLAIEHFSDKTTRMENLLERMTELLETQCNLLEKIKESSS